MQKIKLFVDAHVFDGIHQGSVTFISGLYAELIKDNRFQLYVGSKERSLTEKLLGSNNFVHIKYNSNSKIWRLLYILPKVLIDYKIDIAHFQYISPLIKPCKFIVTIHDLLFLEFPKNFPFSYWIKNSILFYISTKRADLVTTVSSYSKESIHRFLKIPLEKIEITPNAVVQRGDKSEPIIELLNKKYILYVSRIEPRKNQALLINVWKDLGFINQNIDLVLVGAVGLNDNLFLQQIRALSENEKEHFHWLRNIPTEKLTWLYKNCSLFVFPSIAEGFGIPPLEAACYGAKVLCSNTTAMADFDFFNEFLFDPNNIEEFKSKVTKALSTDFSQQSIKNVIHDRYNWEVISKEFATKILEKFCKT